MPQIATYAKGVILLTCIASLWGCKQRSIVGTWKSEGQIPIAITLNNQNQATVSLSAMGFSIALNGDYKVDSNRIIITNLKQNENPMLGSIMQNASRFSNQIPSEFEATFTWKTDDQIVLSGPGPLNGAFTREKSQ